LTTIDSSAKWAELFLFREKESSGKPASPAGDPADKAVSGADESILCRTCRSPVTSHQQSISVNDRHQHTFFNPAGVIYEIRCFKKAPGIVIYGEPTDEFSWFAGHTWQYSICAACQEHLGWFFSSPDAAFYGLIRPRLIAGE